MASGFEGRPARAPKRSGGPLAPKRSGGPLAPKRSGGRLDRAVRHTLAAGALAMGALWAAGGAQAQTPPGAPPGTGAGAIVEGASAGLKSTTTAQGAKDFIAAIEVRMHALQAEAERASWVASNFITDDTRAIEADARERFMAASSEAIATAATFAGVNVDFDTRRKLELLRVASSAPAPLDPERRKAFAQVLAELGGQYGSGKWCPEGAGRDDKRCQDLGALSTIMAQSRDPKELLTAWTRWRTVSPAMKANYARFVELGNEGARSIDFADMGELWRSGYDMPPAEFEAETERLWQQVRPLYEQLHCYVRGRLAKKYPNDVKDTGTLPAHLLGNMWSQEWSEIFPLVEPYPGRAPLDVTAALKAQKWDAKRMVKQAESFFTGLGLRSLPDTFFERSLFLKPQDRDVECHASAWDVDFKGDVRIKMCIETTEADLVTIHHELGHIYYYMYYDDKSILYQSGAHDGFHEAIGDALALSVTPTYLRSIGLLKADKKAGAKGAGAKGAKGSGTKAGAESADKDLINEQLKVALDKIAFLPFGRMIDQWRWDVFSGKVPEAQWNVHWWKLREQYQGIHAPITRPADAFDPGAKYHIPGNTPYVRYFLSFIIQFQFYQALCQAAGHTGPLHTCSFAGSKEAGDRLAKVLAMGSSKPWPDAMEAFTGQRKMDASALMTYFQPLQAWLAQENAGHTCGW